MQILKRVVAWLRGGTAGLNAIEMARGSHHMDLARCHLEDSAGA